MSSIYKIFQNDLKTTYLFIYLIVYLPTHLPIFPPVDCFIPIKPVIFICFMWYHRTKTISSSGN